jgi:membrane-associated protease RseP (regulator of RpoE activity)
MQWSIVVTSIAALGLALGCAKPNPFQAWDMQLLDAPLHGARVDDVSRVLGKPPAHCDDVADPYPTIGVGFDTKNSEQAVIYWVQPQSPAYTAGLQPGDKIASIGGQPVSSPEEAARSIRQRAHAGSPLEVETNRGAFSPVPSVPATQQCYWDLGAGEVARAYSVDQTAGSFSTATHGRFYRAFCRVRDGFVTACKSDWQY